MAHTTLINVDIETTLKLSLFLSSLQNEYEKIEFLNQTENLIKESQTFELLKLYLNQTELILQSEEQSGSYFFEIPRNFFIFLIFFFYFLPYFLTFFHSPSISFSHLHFLCSPSLSLSLFFSLFLLSLSLDVLGSFQAIVSILYTLNDSNSVQEIVNLTVEKLTANKTEKVALRLRILVILFNLLLSIESKLILLKGYSFDFILILNFLFSL